MTRSKLAAEDLATLRRMADGPVEVATLTEAMGSQLFAYRLAAIKGPIPDGPFELEITDDGRAALVEAGLLPGKGCPDGGTCHHSCGEQCWRATVGGCMPLSAFGDEWPSTLAVELPATPALAGEGNGDA